MRPPKLAALEATAPCDYLKGFTQAPARLAGLPNSCSPMIRVVRARTLHRPVRHPSCSADFSALAGELTGQRA